MEASNYGFEGQVIHDDPFCVERRAGLYRMSQFLEDRIIARKPGTLEEESGVGRKISADANYHGTIQVVRQLQSGSSTSHPERKNFLLFEESAFSHLGLWMHSSNKDCTFHTWMQP